MTVVTIGEASGRTFAGQNDTYLNEAAPTTNYDLTRDYYLINSFSVGNRAHALLIYTGLSNIPPGVAVSAVDLQSRTSSVSGNATIAFHRVLVPWTSTETTWNLRSTGVSWASNGGFNATDVDLTPIATFNLTTGTDFLNVNSNSALNSLVEGWINGTIPNYGLMVVRSPDTAYDAVTAFIRGATAAADVSRPVMTVTYTATGATVSTITGTTATEASAVVFTTNMSGTGGLTAAYSWSGTATAGVDYTSTLTDGMFTTTGGSGSVTVSGGNIVVPSAVTEFTVTVPTTGDTLDEANETIRLVFGGVTSSSGTINDDDAAPVITVSDAPSVTAGSPAIFTISLDRAKSTSITVDAACVDGTLVGGVGYTSDLTLATYSAGVTFGAGALTIPAGVTSFTVSIPTT